MKIQCISSLMGIQTEMAFLLLPKMAPSSKTLDAPLSPSVSSSCKPVIGRGTGWHTELHRKPFHCSKDAGL